MSWPGALCRCDPPGPASLLGNLKAVSMGPSTVLALGGLVRSQGCWAGVPLAPDLQKPRLIGLIGFCPVAGSQSWPSAQGC